MIESEKKQFEMPDPLPKDLLLAFSIPNIPEVGQGDNIADIVIRGMEQFGGLQQRDIIVVASKIISKSEGRIVNLNEIVPTQEALDLYEKLGRKSPELLQLILDNAVEYRMENNVIIAKNKLGFVMTSAGVDAYSEREAILLPEDPDQSAKKIMDGIRDKTSKDVAIVISDSEGRADRFGAGAISIGLAGIDPLRIKQVELEDGKIKRTEETIPDMLAGQASLLMGQRGNNLPIVCVRGFSYDFSPKANLRSIIV